MQRFHHGFWVFGLLGALAAVQCGGGDDAGDGGDAGGGSASGGGGSGGSSARGGSGGSGASGGEAGNAGGSDGGKTPLTVADEATETISAQDGGTITLGRLSLEIPAGALEEDTEITIKGFEESAATFVLEPDGLTFNEPILAHYAFSAEPPADGSKLMVVLAATAPLGEPGELITDVMVERTGEGEYRASIELEHFSFVKYFESGFSIEPSSVYDMVDTTPRDMGALPIGPMLGIVHGYTRAEDPKFTVAAGEYSTPQSFEFTVSSVSLLQTNLLVSDNTTAVPDGWRDVPGAPRELGETPVMVTRMFQCDEEGVGFAGIEDTAEIHADVAWIRTAVVYDEEKDEFYDEEQLAGVYFDATFHPMPGGETHTFDCEQDSSLIDGIAGEAIAAALRNQFKASWTEYSYWLSNGAEQQSPNPELALVNVLDPVFEIGESAAARIEAAYPCGEGPLGTTVCGTPGAFTAGDYVFVLATFGGDVPTDDPDGSYQHAFVFDADGVTSNNYVPSAQYPKDFFQGTDKWYQLFYTPSAGFTLKVVDARISTSSAVASGARLIVAGREFAAFIPRAELGTNPGFRVSSFRHEGDYGLQGGPWNLSYYPPLDEPLMPAAAGDPIVLPED